MIRVTFGEPIAIGIELTYDEFMGPSQTTEDEAHLHIKGAFSGRAFRPVDGFLVSAAWHDCLYGGAPLIYSAVFGEGKGLAGLEGVAVHVLTISEDNVTALGALRGSAVTFVLGEGGRDTRNFVPLSNLHLIDHVHLGRGIKLRRRQRALRREFYTDLG